jgi:sugar phosphate isomerase/epimerase
MTTVTVDRGEPRARVRRPGDALPDASIGTVLILWTNAAEAARWDTTAILDEIARLGYEGTQRGAGFPSILNLDDVLGALVERAFDGWLMVEQDRSVGPRSESAAIGRRVLAASLRRLGTDRRMRSVA